MSEPKKPASTTGRWRPGPGLTVLIVLGLAALLINWAASFWTEILWYDQMGALRVLLTRWGATAGMFALGFLFVAIPMRLTLVSAWKNRSAADRGTPSASLRGYQEAVEPMRSALFWAIPILVGLMNGSALGSNWQTILTFLNRTPFGRTDPQFGLDVSFYVFTLPFVELFINFFIRLLVILLVTAIIANYLYGTIRFVPRPHASKPARLQMGILAAALSLVVAAWYWVERYALLTGGGRSWDGAMFADITATLPARSILAVVSALVAILFVVAAFRGTWRLPVIGVVLTAVSALVIGGAYPALIQQFRVVPNERQLESPYIQRNIDATLAAYGLENLEFQTYDAKTSVQPGQLRSDTETTAQIRLLDPLVIEKTVQQLQQSKPYYSFTNGFAVDRYTVDGERRDTVIAMRELNLTGLDEKQRTWANLHTVFTHGFGVVAAYGNQVTAGGLPAYWEQSIPSKGEMGEYEPRIYFSPSTTDYSIVGAPQGAPDQELDYPDDTAPGGQVSTTFTGNGGPSVGNAWNKLLYSIKFGSTDIFFSSQTNEASQILYDRDPLLRVSKVAPYLTLEQEAYPAVVDMDGNPSTPKRLVWVVDAYTTSDDYPYSQHRQLDQSTVDSRNSEAGEFVRVNSVNYMRNSVKAVVDAYDGSVRLFRWDEQDPVLATWMKIYPGSVEPMSAISGDLMGHLRYPEDLFKVQRELLTSYHVTNAADFYTGGDKWRLAQETSTATSTTVTQTDVLGNETQVPVAQPPYYLTMKMPGQETAEFSLTSVFVPGGTSNRQAMAGFLAVDSETGSQAGKVREGYGKLRLIALPSSTTVPGPGQIQNAYDTGEKIAPQLNILNLSDSKVIRGNLLTLPVGGGLLYVQPVYIQGSGNAQYPILRFVLTAFGDQVGFAPTLAESLDQTFGGDSAAKVAHGGDEGASSNQGGNTGTPPVKRTAQERLDAAVVNAVKAMKASETARIAGDWAAYGKAQKELDAALTQAVAAQQEMGRDVSGAIAPLPEGAQSGSAGTPAQSGGN